MKGHIRERSPGHWAIVIDIPDPQTGKRRTKWHSFKGTKREAQIECSRLVTAITGGTYQQPNKITLREFLPRWLDHMKSQVTPKSHERYTGIVNQNIIPALGAVQTRQPEGGPNFRGLQQRPRQRAQGRQPAVSPLVRSDTCTAFLSRRSDRPSAGNC